MPSVTRGFADGAGVENSEAIYTIVVERPAGVVLAALAWPVTVPAVARLPSIRSAVSGAALADIAPIETVYQVWRPVA